MRVFQGQHIGQCDQRAYSLDLLQQCGLRIALLRDGFDAQATCSRLRGSLRAGTDSH